jgi:alkylation response protein AidB-like acyl-CoA dehydrogenase
MTGALVATTDIDHFRSTVESWLDQNQTVFAPSYQGSGTLDEQMTQLTKVKRLAYDAGFMRCGWPERVGGLGGSTLLRAYLGEALTTRGLSAPSEAGE